MRTQRIEFFVNFLSLKKNPLEALQSADHLLKRIESLWFNRRQKINYYNGSEALWNVVRKFLLARADKLISKSTDRNGIEFDELNEHRAVQALVHSRLGVERMLPLFDMMFEVE